MVGLKVAEVEVLKCKDKQELNVVRAIHDMAAALNLEKNQFLIYVFSLCISIFAFMLYK